MPTPYSFDFTEVAMTELKNGNEQGQSVTNFLKTKSGPGEPGPYNSKRDHACGAISGSPLRR